MPTAGVVCPDGVSETWLLAALRSYPAGAGKGPLPLLPWPYHLSYCNWRSISRGIWDLPLAGHVPGSGAGLGAGRKMGEPRLRLQPGRPGSGETGLSFGVGSSLLPGCLPATLPCVLY